MLGVVAGAYLSAAEAKRRKLDPEFLWDSLLWMVIGGVIGARLWHVFTPPPSMVQQGITTGYYLTHPLDALNTRSGGMGMAGAVIGGIFALYIYCRKKKQKFSLWLDVLAPALPLGQAIGRWGNFFNQELYGAPTDLPWGIEIDLLHRLPEYAQYSRYHPIFLYESLWNLASVFFLLWVARKYQKNIVPGDIFLLYMLTYPFIRFWLDFIRLDASKVGGLNANQTFMAVVFLCSAIALFLRHREKA